MAREPSLACGHPETRRWIYDRTRLAREGSKGNRRVGKMKKVVKRRGVGVLVFAVEIFFLVVQGSQLSGRAEEVCIGVGLDLSGSGRECRVGTGVG